VAAGSYRVRGKDLDPKLPRCVAAICGEPAERLCANGR